MRLVRYVHSPSDSPEGAFDDLKGVGGIEVVGVPVEASDECVTGGLEAGAPVVGQGDELLDGFVSRLADEAEGGLEGGYGGCGHPSQDAA